MTPPTSEELLAFLEEQLSAERMAEIEQALRSDVDLQQRLAGVVRQHDPGARGHRRGDRGADRVAVGYHGGCVDLEAPAAQRVDDEGAGLVGVHPGRGAVAGDHDGCRQQRLAHVRVQSPERPPDFASTRTSVMTAALSTALTMSITVSAATVTAVTWFVVMVLMLDDEPHRSLRLWLEALAVTTTVATGALAVCATVKAAEQRVLAALRDDRP